MICSSMTIAPLLLKILPGKWYSRWTMWKYPNNGARSLPIFLHKNISVRPACHRQTAAPEGKPPLNRWPTVWPIAGGYGVNVMVTLHQKTMHRYFMMNWYTVYWTGLRAQQPAMVQHWLIWSVWYFRKPQGHYFVDAKDGQLKKSTSAYERPQPHACFILSVEDDLVNDGGIMDLWCGSPYLQIRQWVGTNFSSIRGEGRNWAVAVHPADRWASWKLATVQPVP